MLEFRVLLCDDDEPYAKSLAPLASMYGFDIHYFQTWEEAQAELEQRFDLYDAIILDAKGQKNSASVRNDIRALTSAVRWLQRKEGEGKYIPYVINSAFVETSESIGYSDIDHFDKTQSQEKELFSRLKELITSKDAFSIKKKYKDVFEVFGGKYLPIADSNKFLRALQLQEKGLIEQKDFNTLRDLLEALYLRLNQIDSKLLPNDLIAEGRPNLDWSWRFLTGLKTDVKKGEATLNTYLAKPSIVPRHIGSSLIYIKNITSNFSHNSEDYWTKYAFSSTVLALAEVLVWFKKFVDRTYPNL